jgi:predicted secreted Zn-dependent protease
VPALELLALTWRKSSASSTDDCVEVAAAGGMIIVRDSKDPDGGNLLLSSHDWSIFVVGVRKRTLNPPL